MKTEIYGVEVPEKDSWGHPLGGEVLYNKVMYEDLKAAKAASSELEFELTRQWTDADDLYEYLVDYGDNNYEVSEETLTKLINLVYHEVIDSFSDDEICQVNNLLGGELYSKLRILSNPTDNLSAIKELCHPPILKLINSVLETPIRCSVAEYQLVLK